MKLLKVTHELNEVIRLKVAHLSCENFITDETGNFKKKTPLQPKKP